LVDSGQSFYIEKTIAQLTLFTNFLKLLK